MPYDREGNYTEPGFCNYCGVRLDAAGDCPNLFCSSKLEVPLLDPDDDAATTRK